MADNTTVTPGAGLTVATDDVAGVHYQKFKIADGTADSTNMAVVNSAGELAVARNDAIATGSLAASAATTAIVINGDATVAIQATGTHVGTNVFEATNDGTNWFSVLAYPSSGGAPVISFTANGAWQLICSGFAQVRVRRSAHTSGTVVMSLRASVATLANEATVTGPVAAGTAIAGNPIPLGLRSQTANPTAVATGQISYAMADKVGRMVVVQGAPRELIGRIGATFTGTVSGASFIAAGGAGVFTDITSLTLTNSSATTVTVALSDGTRSYTYVVAAGGGVTLPFNPPLPASTVNTAWTLTASGSITFLYANAVWILNV